MPIAFFCRARPQGCDAFAIFEQARRVFIGYPLLRIGSEYDPNNLRHCLVDLTVDEQEWGREKESHGRFKPQYTANRNLARQVTPGSIAVIPRPHEGVVYIARITGEYDIVNAPGWAGDYLTLRKTQGLDADDAENRHIADVAQGWAIDEYRQFDLTQLPGWIRRTMHGRGTYAVFGEHPADPDITAHAVLERLVGGESRPVASWTLDLDDIKRRLVDTLFPSAFECLVVSLLQLERPHESWHQAGGPGDGGVDGIGSDEEGNVAGLMQAKLYARHAPNFQKVRPRNPDTRLYSAVLTPERPKPPGGGVHLLDLNWIAKAVRRHWRCLPQARAMRVGEDESTKSWLYGKAERAPERASGMPRKTESVDDIIAAMMRERAQRKRVSAEEIREYREWGRR